MLARVPSRTKDAWKKARKLRRIARKLNRTFTKNGEYGTYRRFARDEVPDWLYSGIQKLSEDLYRAADELEIRGDKFKTLNALNDDKKG